MRNPDPAGFARRTKITTSVFMAGLLLVVVRSAQLQVKQHENMTELARSQYENDIRIPERRGQITDRNGEPLAISVDMPSVHANPSAIDNPKEVSAQLAKLLDLNASELNKRLSTSKKFIWLKRHIAPEVALKIQELNLQGIAITKEPKRFYPHREVGAHVLGFTGLDAKGLEGMERALDAQIAGESQVVAAVRDARGNKVLAGELDPDQRSRGHDVRLTLDLKIQHATQDALRRALKTTKAKNAMAVVLDVPSAEILAMATEPAFNPNQASTIDASLRRNRTVTDVFEPASTLKPLVVAAALDAGAIKESSGFFCENGRMAIGRRTIRDVKPSGWLTVTQIIAKSSNIGTAKIGMAMGREGMEQALRDYGFGSRSGVTFPGEVPGLFRPSQKWSEVGFANIAFGQGIAVTALQLAAAYRVLAAGGAYRTPRLIRWFERPYGGVSYPEDLGFTFEERRVLKNETAAIITHMLRAAVSQEGTGKRATVLGYEVAGKTGTSQKIDPVTGAYSQRDYIAAFGGFLPAEAPEVVVVVVLDEPKGDHTGGLVAAPVFSEIAEAAMRQLRVLPTIPPVAELDPPAVTLKTAVASKAKPTPPPSEPVVDAEPPIETHKSDALPSFVGLTAREAVALYTKADVKAELEMEGSGRVAKQEPKAGAKRNAVQHVKLILK